MIDCKYHTPVGTNVGQCSIGKFGGFPSTGVCQYCILTGGNKPRGAGDRVAHAIHKATGGKIKPCGGCKKRQELLNKLLPSKD